MPMLTAFYESHPSLLRCSVGWSSSEKDSSGWEETRSPHKDQPQCIVQLPGGISAGFGWYQGLPEHNIA
jgi:hypothetical protein